MVRASPKGNYKCCAFCCHWDGNAHLESVDGGTNIKYNEYEFGKCKVQNNNRKVGNDGTKCPLFFLSNEAASLVK